MNYLTIKEVSEKWEISTRTAISYCEKGLIEGATYKGAWFIPTDTEKGCFQESLAQAKIFGCR